MNRFYSSPPQLLRGTRRWHARLPARPDAPRGGLRPSLHREMIEMMATLHMRQDAPRDGLYPIRLTLAQAGKPNQDGEASIAFSLPEQEQEDLRWYLEDYLERADTVPAVTVQQIEGRMKARGEELYAKVLDANASARAIWYSIRNELADRRVEITSGIAEAASIPWELLRDPDSDSPLSIRAKSFVRVQSNPNISFVTVPPAKEGRVRLLYVVCRPGGSNDVALRAVANRLLQDLGADRNRFEIKALRPPTFEQLESELKRAKKSGRPFHIVHFDGHGIYADLGHSKLADWVAGFSALMLGGKQTGKHGYLMFEHPGEDRVRPVSGEMLGKLLHDTGVPMLVLNACQSAMHQATEAPKSASGVHDEIRAIGSLAQAVIDQGIPAVLGMRYSVYVVTAAQYIGKLYMALATGGGFGEAATEGRRNLHDHPDRWIGLHARPLQDWFVPVVYEAMPIELFSAKKKSEAKERPELDPIQLNRSLRLYVPEEGFIGRDETLLALDRAFDGYRIVLLHAYAGQGKSSAAVEFARWYALTGGLGERPIVLFQSFEKLTDLDDLLNQIGQPFSPMLESRGKKPWSATNAPAERLATVKRLLREFPVLWIWDNIEPVAGFPEGTESQWTQEEQADLKDFLLQIKEDNASQVKILLTSRREEHGWLGGLPHRIPMLRMRNADAAALALKLGEETKLHRSDIADWQPLLDYCGGNPLTLTVLVRQAVKMGVHGKQPIGDFVEAIRSGEHAIEDVDEAQGRDKSLGASLAYGFQHAFKADELPIIALLHLFQGTVDIDALHLMGTDEAHALPELKGKSKEHLTDLLERARETGLLTQIGPAYFTIHPALPWFLRRLFARHYDGQAGHSSAEAALRAWVEAVCQWGNFYHSQFGKGNQRVINLLALEEANLLHARRLARRKQWHDPILSCMQGLNTLYEYHGRMAEWATLVEQITPDYCTAEDEPIPGREEGFSVVMTYRMDLAKNHERDLSKAASLREKTVHFDRAQAAAALALAEDAPLSDVQRNELRSLAVSVQRLGQILSEAGNEACLTPYQESLAIYRRIGDKQGQAVVELNLGHAYKNLAAIRNLDAAEGAYQRSLGLRLPNDALGRSRCIQQIGSVHHERFREARKREEPVETQRLHAHAAKEHYHQGLEVCPKDAFASLFPKHNQLGSLYAEFGQIDSARQHFEQSAHYAEKAGDHFGAGQVRLNVAIMYEQASERETDPSLQRDTLLRARAYAEAAIRDYQHYEGRAADREAETQRLIEYIDQRLANPSE